MGQPAAKKIDSATPAQDDIQKFEQAINARQIFYSSVLDMGWRLALVVLVPIIGGVKLDDHYNTTPSWTLTALVISAFAATLVVSKSVKQANQTVNNALQDPAKKAPSSSKVTSKEKKS